MILSPVSGDSILIPCALGLTSSLGRASWLQVPTRGGWVRPTPIQGRSEVPPPLGYFYYWGFFWGGLGGPQKWRVQIPCVFKFFPASGQTQRSRGRRRVGWLLFDTPRVAVVVVVVDRIRYLLLDGPLYPVANPIRNPKSQIPSWREGVSLTTGDPPRDLLCPGTDLRSGLRLLVCDKYPPPPPYPRRVSWVVVA